MKILMINDYKDTIGGTEIYMLRITERLRKRGHDVLVFTSGVTSQDYFSPSYNTSFTKYMIRIFHFSSYKMVKRLLKEFTPDVVHVHGISNELSPSILLAIKGTPVIMTVHNNLLVNAVSLLSLRSGKECKNRTCGGCINCVGLKGAIYESIKRKVHSILLRNISLFITPSQYMCDLMLEAGFSPVICIPNGIVLLKHTPLTHYLHVLYVGRLTRDKGVEYLLRAMPKVIESFSHVKLLLVGEGADAAYLRNLAEELNIMEHVIFTGAVSELHMQRYYENATVVVIPSIYQDNFPTVAMEAMSVGRPVVGTRVGGIPELVHDGKTGVLVAPRSSEGLSEEILILLSDKRLLTYISTHQKERAKQFSLERHVKELEKVYMRIVT